MNKKIKNKFKEIGSNYWLAPKQMEQNELLIRDHHFIDENEKVVYSSSGRGAISLLLSQIVKKDYRVLLPLYTCQAVIQPFLMRGFEIGFYNIKKDLSVNNDEFNNLVNKFNPTVVLFHTYFGFDTNKKIRSDYKLLVEKEITVIEDITHAMFSDFDKSGAEYYLASIRKWFSLPDGGVAIAIKNKIKSGNHKTHDELIAINKKAIRMKYEYIKKLDSNLKIEYRKLFYSTEEMLDQDCDFYAMSSLSRTIFAKTDLQGLKAFRRSNYSYLLSRLRESRLIEPIFTELPNDVVPLYFPVYVRGDRDKLRAFLAANEIYAPVHWPIPPSIGPCLSTDTGYIYEKILSIPCDQRYDAKDMDRIVQKVSEYPH